MYFNFTDTFLFGTVTSCCLCWNLVPYYVGFEVFTAVVMKSIIFWDMMPCSPLSFNRRFRGTYRLHLQGQRYRFSKPVSKQEACPDDTLVPYCLLGYCTWTLIPVCNSHIDFNIVTWLKVLWFNTVAGAWDYSWYAHNTRAGFTIRVQKFIGTVLERNSNECRLLVHRLL
jgi:hypothetical protein